MILDSKAYVRNRIKELVCDYQINVYEAVNSFQLLTILTELNYDVSLIVMEVNLEKESGIDILHKLKKRGIEVPVLIVTSENRRKEFAKSIRAGAVDYILKPFDEKMLLNRIVKGMDKKNKNTNKESEENDKKVSLDFQDYLSKELENAKNKDNVFSLMMITLFKAVDEFTSDMEKEYVGLGNIIYPKLKEILEGADLFIKYGAQSFVATFKVNSENKEKIIIQKINEFFKDIKQQNKRFEEYYLECAFANYPEDGNNKEELISKVTYKIVDKINQIKGTEKK
ncbi:response regulator [Clostridium bovifaecis]|uniref:Stage 0 sporulation protein A homolog n=1 Tax=Clostridium bovifaecis TaxID=2184719 RepID=A0A6I6F8B2_9CLOT|nr:response regulator [Clostridium bovifaecis]